MEYARMLDLPFEFCSIWDVFAEHDFLTGKDRQFSLKDFPTEAELIERFKRESGLSPAQETAISQPYYSSQNTYPPRYYQRIAINRTVDAIARGQQRLLLVMATGTGKTRIFFKCNADWHDGDAERNQVYFQSELFWRTGLYLQLERGY